MINSGVRRSRSIAVVIPAYEPEGALVDLVRDVIRRLGAAVVVVDDGSSRDRVPVFAAVSRLPGVTLLAHATNRGKGQALKTAFRFVMATMPDVVGVVTADADGQHLPVDIAAVAARLAARPDRLVLGRRRLDRGAPWRSRLGNALSRRVFRLVTGRTVADTQTGLRGVPAALLADLVRLRPSAYDFELDALLLVTRLGLAIDEIPVATVYADGNRTSHFQPVRDSAKVYLVFLRFVAAALAGAAAAGLEAATAGQLALAETE